MQILEMRVIFTGLIAMLLFLNSSAETNTYSIDTTEGIYTFSDQQQFLNYQALLNELRCPKCQNQSLADSDAHISLSLRNKIYELISQGKNKQQIKLYLQQRYGNFILYQPPLTTNTFLLWGGPLLFIVVLTGFISLYLHKNSIAENNKANE